MPASRIRGASLVAIVGLLAGCAPVSPSVAPSAATSTPRSSQATATPFASPAAAAEMPDVPFYRGDTLRSAIEPGPGPVAEPVVAWDVPLDQEATVNPILVGGAVIVGTDHEVIAIDAMTGERRWATPIDGRLEGAFSAASGVIVATATDAVHGLDAGTGASRWVVDRESTLQRPDIVDGIAYLGSDDGLVIGVDVLTGATTWSWQGPRRIQVRVDLVADGVVYVSTDDGRLFTVAVADSTEGWTYQVQGSRAVPSKVDDTVFVSSGLDDGSPRSGQVVALDVVKGTPRWRFSSPSGEQAVHGASRDGLVYVTTRADGMYALRDDGGSQATVWHADVPLTDWPSVLSGDVLYVATREAGVYAVDGNDGRVLWHTPAGDEGRGPIVSGGRLFAIVGGHVIAWAEPSLLAGTPTATAAPGATPAASAAARSPFAIVRSFDSATTGISVGPQTDGPEGVVLDVGPDGLLYALDVDAIVSVIDPSTGAIVRTWGGKGHGDGQFDGAFDIAVGPDGRVYATDQGSHRVQVFDSDGRFLKQLGSFGTSLGQFDRPAHLDVGSDGSLYVEDGPTITRFAPDGNVDWRVGGPEAENAKLRRETYDLAVLPEGRLLVTIDGGGRALVLDVTDGSVIGEWGPPDIGPSAEPAVAPDGTVWLFQYIDDRIDILTADGSRLARHLPGSDAEFAMKLYPTPVVAPNGHAYTFERDLGLVELAVDLGGG
jgi:outer membrane protein assembly factor BamB